MDSLFPILIGIAASCAAVALILVLLSSKNSRQKKQKPKSRSSIIRTAEKRLSQDPRDPSALLPLSDLYYKEQQWEKAFPLLTTIAEIIPVYPEIDVFQTALRLGICSVKLGKLAEALKSLSVARRKEPDNFETNFYLGQAFYLNKDYDKAVPFFKKAASSGKDVPELFEYLGLSLYKGRLFREALPYLKRALDAKPESKELLFSMADSMHACSMGDKALKVFMHLRADPEYGARSCLLAGGIHSFSNQNAQAIQDYEIGLKHTEAPLDVLTQIRYNLAQIYLQENDMVKALNLLQTIQITVPGYKDVRALISRYQELSQNNTLKTYLMATNSDFVALCRKIVSVFYSKATVRILSVDAKPDVAEIQTEIETVKWEDSVVFRFYRNTGSTGELYIRDFHGRIRDLKAGRGICITAGTYSDDAKKFVEGRPIDLVDKAQLLKIFTKL
ncbi:tetratricopeptide repeat protein [Treponema sp. OMZ 840]|uniref:tetratricopeptide repeat protein n=1 Tax=Treponema sp. OMZ 840 TaxID=244313 RepID=UPI003D8E7C55